MAWLKDVLNPFTLSSNAPGTPENQLKKSKRTAQAAKRVLDDQVAADRRAQYEAEVNAGVRANGIRVQQRGGARSLGASGGSAVGSSLGATPSAATLANQSLTDILARIRGIQF